jgi:hypothetical protein
LYQGSKKIQMRIEEKYISSKSNIDRGLQILSRGLSRDDVRVIPTDSVRGLRGCQYHLRSYSDRKAVPSRLSIIGKS